MTATMTREAAATDRLSRAASAIWRYRTAGPDPTGDPSGEREHILKIIADAGYATPGEYNADLRSRMCDSPRTADGRQKMTYRVYELLCVLEADDCCPSCGTALDVTTHRTRAYGGGWDTFVCCPACGWAAAYV